MRLLSALICTIALIGCSVHTRENENGKKNDVDIKTPFGSLSVREGHTDVKDTGLSLYPGARVKKDFDENNRSANVDISSSLFGVKVVALRYESDDAPEKVLAYYRKEMGKYGKVVDCTGGVPSSVASVRQITYGAPVSLAALGHAKVIWIVPSPLGENGASPISEEPVTQGVAPALLA